MSRLSQSLRHSSILLLSVARSFCQSSSVSHSTELLMMTGVSPICRFLAKESRSTLDSTTQPSDALGGRENVSDGVPCNQMP